MRALPLAISASTARGPMPAAISSRPRFEDGGLGGGQVVARQPGDPLEQPGPHPVVEELGGDGGRVPQQALPDLGERGPPRNGEVRRRGRAPEGGPGGHRSARDPDAGGLPAGVRAEEVPVGRAQVGRGVRQDPPRSTIWPDMNLPLYSPTAPAAGR